MANVKALLWIPVRKTTTLEQTAKGRVMSPLSMEPFVRILNVSVEIPKAIATIAVYGEYCAWPVPKDRTLTKGYDAIHAKPERSVGEPRTEP